MKYNKKSGIIVIEVLMSVTIAMITIGGIMQGYIMSSQRLEWILSSQAANNQISMRMEQIRSAKWDSQSYPLIDEVVSSNFPNAVVIFDFPVINNVLRYGTNYINIVQISPTIKMVSIDCVWSILNRGTNITNTISTYIVPN